MKDTIKRIIRAIQNKPTQEIILGVNVRRCSECDRMSPATVEDIKSISYKGCLKTCLKQLKNLKIYNDNNDHSYYVRCTTNDLIDLISYALGEKEAK